MMQIATVTSFV